MVFSEGEAEGKFFLCLAVDTFGNDTLGQHSRSQSGSAEGTNSQDGRKHTTKYSTLVFVVARAKGIDSGGDTYIIRH